MRVKLVDRNIAHIHNYGGYDKCEDFEWYRGADHTKIGVFTDHMLPYHGKLGMQFACDIRVAWIMEPPCINMAHWHYMEKESVRDQFDYILTYSQEHIDKWGPKAMWYPGGGSQMPGIDWQLYPKSKDILIVMSDKKYAPGHKLRWDIVEEFGDHLDVIGRGIAPFPEGGRAAAYKDHRYQIYVQNMIMPDMWGDRLIDCFLTGTVPIVWGGKFLGKYFNPAGYLTFENMDELRGILGAVIADGPRMYEDALPAIRENFYKAANFGVVENYFWTELFSKL